MRTTEHERVTLASRAASWTAADRAAAVARVADMVEAFADGDRAKFNDLLIDSATSDLADRMGDLAALCMTASQCIIDAAAQRKTSPSTYRRALVTWMLENADDKDPSDG